MMRAWQSAVIGAALAVGAVACLAPSPAPTMGGQASPAVPSCVLLDPLMADQGLAWQSLPCWYRGDAVTPPFLIGAQPVKGTV